MSDEHKRCFPPLVGSEPKVLILGSLPGQRSLEEQRYYAHPRNAFWPIISAYFGFDAEGDYESRVEGLKHHPVVVWDVLKSAVRPGSLDASIVAKSASINDFSALFNTYVNLSAVLFNGKASAQLFRKHVSADLNSRITLFECPSTSPANAAMTLNTKKALWFEALDSALNLCRAGDESLL